MRSSRIPAEALRLLAPAVVGLVFVLIFMEPTPFEIRVGDLSIDQWCADAFYWPSGHRWSLGHAGWPKAIYYVSAKVIVIAVAALLGLIALAPARWLAPLRTRLPRIPPRRDSLFLVLCLALIPLACNGEKAVSNIYCPYDHFRYNGCVPYVRLWDDYPDDFKALQLANPSERGRSFPAGHASGGFALLAFAFTLRRRWVGVALGTATGWSMGLYQMARGAHYLSHTLVTWCVAWLIVVLCAAALRPSGWKGRASGD